MKLTPERLLAAWAATESRRALIQGFLYGEGTLHTVRDLCKREVVWQGEYSLDNYDDGHAAMQAAIRLAKFRLIVEWLERNPTQSGTPEVEHLASEIPGNGPI